MKNDKTYVRINLPPRKSSVDIYFILVPKVFLPTFPLLSASYEGEKVKRGGSLITSNSLGNVWCTGARRAQLYHPCLGPHHLRSAFRTRCAELGIPEATEWMMGRGGDVYGYDRSGFDETFLIEGPENQDGTRKGDLNVLWSGAATVDRQTVRGELEVRDQKIERLEAQVLELSKYVVYNQVMIDAAGGDEAVTKRGLKSGLFRTRKDGSIETTEKLRAKIEKKSKRKKP